MQILNEHKLVKGRLEQSGRDLSPMIHSLICILILILELQRSEEALAKSQASSISDIRPDLKPVGKPTSPQLSSLSPASRKRVTSPSPDLEVREVEDLFADYENKTVDEKILN